MKFFSRRGLGLFAALSLLRIALTSNRDVLAVNGGYDEYWYVSSALHAMWGQGYTRIVAAHLPIYPLWLRILSEFGIPGRLAIDVAWILASFYLAFAVRQLITQPWVGLALFIFLAFHPYGIVIFDRALPETLLTVLTAFTLAGFIEIWNTRRDTGSRRSLAWFTTVIGFAAAYHTRSEGIVLLVPLGLLIAWAVYQRKTWWSPAGRREIAYPILVAPIIATMLMGLFIVGCNYLRWGVSVRSEFSAPGYVSAMDALYAIDSGPTPKHVTLTAKTRALAYSVSPTFRELRGFFEGPIGQALAAYTAQFTGVSGEIANGWMYWAVRDAAASVGWHKDPRFAESKYRAVADELQRAFQSGLLPHRPVLVSLIDPDIGKWGGYVPRAFIKELKLVVAPDSTLYELPPENATPKQFEDFVRIFGRRRLAPTLYVAGWITAPPGTLVGVGPGSQAMTWKILEGPTRPDVTGALPFQLTSERGQLPTELVVRTPDEEIGSLAIAALHAGIVKDIPGMKGTRIGIDELSGGPTQSWDWITPLSRIYAVWGWALGVFGLMGLALGMVRLAPLERAPALVLVVAGSAVLARVGLLSILDASSWNALQTRYLFPVVPAFAVFGFVGLWMLLQRAPRRPL